MSADKDGLLHRSLVSAGSLETATTYVSNVTDGHSWHSWTNVGAAAAVGGGDKDSDAPSPPAPGQLRELGLRPI